MIQAIRIEHTDGIGMFRQCDLDYIKRKHSLYCFRNTRKYARDIINRHCNFNTLYEDFYNATENHFCAYKSIDHIQQWITKKELSYLFKKGYSVYLLELSEVVEGEDQYAFLKEWIINKTDISSLFK